jgi:raffinose/stachyose/melibiose transport system permease protein
VTASALRPPANPLGRALARPGHLLERATVHGLLLFYTAIALGPIVLIVLNSLKERRAIFDAPAALPTPETFSLVGYETLLKRSSFESYFGNSLVVTLGSMALVLLIGSMAAFALSEYRFRGNRLIALYLALGIMIPIRLGTVSLLQLFVGMGLVNTLLGLVLVYTAQGLPLAVFILGAFMRDVPRELKDAARVDGASEYRIYGLVLPLVRPALAVIATFTMIPIWNDLWWPLILAPSRATATVTLGAQQFLGQFVSDWNAVLAALTLAILPVLLLYFALSRQLIRGVLGGALK